MVGGSSRASTQTWRRKERAGKRKRFRQQSELPVAVFLNEHQPSPKRKKHEKSDEDLNSHSMNPRSSPHQDDAVPPAQGENVKANKEQDAEKPSSDNHSIEMHLSAESRGHVASEMEEDGDADAENSSDEEKQAEGLSSGESMSLLDEVGTWTPDEDEVPEYPHSDLSDFEEYLFADTEGQIHANIGTKPEEVMPELEESDNSDDENPTPTTDLPTETLRRVLEASRKDADDLGYESDEDIYEGANEHCYEIPLDNRWNSCFQLMRWNHRTEKSIKAARCIAARYRAGHMKDEGADETRQGHIGRFKAKKLGESVPRESLTSRCVNSFALLVSGKGLTELQYGAIYSLISICLKCIESSIIVELLSSYEAEDRSVRNFIDDKIGSIKAIFMAGAPIFSLTQAKRDTRTHLQYLRLKSKTVTCSTKKGKVARTRLIKPSTLIEADLLFDETAKPLLERPRCDVKFAPVLFYDCPFAANPWALTRPAPFGALADQARFCDEAGITTGIKRTYTSRLFAQGSILALHTSANVIVGQDRRSRKRSCNYVQNCTLLPHIVATPKGDPFVLDEKKESFTSPEDNKVHIFEDLLKWADNADILWPITIEREMIVNIAGSLQESNAQAGGDALDILINKADAYLCHTFATGDGAPKHKDGRNKFMKYILFIGRSSDKEEKQNCTGQIEVYTLEVLKDPPNWVKGDLRPIVGPKRANPYRLKRFDKRTGAQIVVIPIILYTDKFNRGEGKKASMAGYYFLPIGMQSHYRSGAQSVRVASATSDGMDPNTPIFASIDDLQKMENEGKLMQTCHGPKWVYFKVVGFNVDYVQAADSTHSLSHSATCPCTICAMRRGEEGHVRYCQVTGSASLSICINQDRLNALKQRGLGKLAFAYCGIKDGVNSRPESFLDGPGNIGEPKETRRGSKPPYNALLLLSQCSGADPAFEYTLGTLPAPDHCAGMGTSKGSLNMTFCALKPNRHSILSDRLIEAARLSGLPTPDSVLKTEGSIANGYIAGLSVAHLSSLLVVAPVVLATMEDDFESASTYRAVCDIVTSAAEIISLIYFTPKPVCDTEEEAKQRYEDVRQVADLAADYLILIKGISLSAYYSDNLKRAVIKFCDVPNLHRFFEICCFWLPAAGYNIYHLAEIIFEKAHQFIKRYTHYVPGNFCAGEFSMRNYLNDLTLRRLALAFGRSRDGPGGEFSWEGNPDEQRLFESLKPFFNPPKRSSADEDNRPAANFIAMHEERNWNTFERHMVKGSGDIWRVAKELNLTSSEINGCYTQTRYGLFREPRHYTLKVGHVVSGITLQTICTEATQSEDDGRIVRLRPGKVSELSLEQSFGEARVTVLVKEIWNVSRNSAPSSSKVGKNYRIWVRGHLLIPNSEDRKDLKLPVFEMRRHMVWMKLDRSCRRQACFPLVRTAGGSLRPEITAKAKNGENSGKYIVLGHQDGYPGRSA